jgi:CRISPR-associated protein Cmr1
MITIKRSYELITPLFGGGVQPQQYDPITIVRPTAIRGHLRFWWRAVRGGQYDGDLAKMRTAEAELWGSASNKDAGGPSKVQIEVIITEDDRKRLSPLIPEHRDLPTFDQRGQSVNVADRKKARELKGMSYYKKRGSNELKSLTIGDPESCDSYLAFPLRSDRGKPAGQVWEGVRFQIKITYPQQQKAEVEAALWAWETFGGIGARTRRGFGSLQVNEPTPTSTASIAHPMQWIKEQLAKHIAGTNWPADVPHLSLEPNFRLIQQQKTDAKTIWRKLGTHLRNFRQQRSGNNGRGRSRWTEPDLIRAEKQQWYVDPQDPHHNHKKPVYGKVIRATPRAVFGLPILFQFHYQQKGTKANTDPDGNNQVTNSEKDKTRFASPLIIRPLVLPDGQTVGLAMLLEGSKPPTLQADFVQDRSKRLTIGINADDAKLLNIKGLEVIAGQPIKPRDLLLAFLRFIDLEETSAGTRR